MERGERRSGLRLLAFKHVTEASLGRRVLKMNNRICFAIRIESRRQLNLNLNLIIDSDSDSDFESWGES